MLLNKKKKKSYLDVAVEVHQEVLDDLGEDVRCSGSSNLGSGESWSCLKSSSGKLSYDKWSKDTQTWRWLDVTEPWR